MRISLLSQSALASAAAAAAALQPCQTDLNLLGCAGALLELA